MPAWSAVDIAPGPVVATTAGPVRGREKDGVRLFASIPFAATTAGANRFRPPAPPAPWTEVRPTQRFGPAAPQRPGQGLTNSFEVAWDEECLTLNVATPACDDGRRPVFVWIHGGNFRNGQGATPWYNGRNLARNGDLVVVSINYRLGAFGYTHLADLDPTYPTSGVCGLLDQVAALRWVRDNITGFGGDPGRVTVAGESAGAFSAAALLAMPAARGLFHRAILQSGAGHHAVTTDQGARVAERLLAAAGATSAVELAGLDADAVLDAQLQVESELGGLPRRNPIGLETLAPFYPVVDGHELPGVPIEAIAAGASADVPVLIGTNADELTLFGIGGDLSEEKLVRYVEGYTADANEVIAAYRAAMPGASTGRLALAIGTDWAFRVPAVRLAEARHAHGGGTWMYRFAWRSPAFGGFLGATHALEVPFVFHTLDAPGVSAFTGEEPPPRHLADAMHQAWIAFVRTGDPSCAALPAWPIYDPDQRAVMELDESPRRRDDPEGAELAVWSGRR